MKLAGRFLKVFIDDANGAPQDVSGDLDYVELPNEFGEVDVTGLGQGGGDVIPGMPAFPVELKGTFNPTATTGLFTVLKGLRGSYRGKTMAVAIGNNAIPTASDKRFVGEFWLQKLTTGMGVKTKAPILASLRPFGETAPHWDTPYEEMVLDLLGASLIQYLPLDDLSGSTAADASGNSRTGGYLGTYTLGVAGPTDFGMAYGVDLLGTGEIDGYSASLAGAFDSDTGMLACWVRPNSSTIWRDANIYNVFLIGVSSTMYIECRVAINYIILVDSRAGTSPFVIAVPPTTARWIHLAFTWDKPNDRISMYVNGSRLIPSSGLGTWSGSIAANFVRYGDTSPSMANRNWPGKMAHVVVTNAIPSDSVIWQLAGSPHQVIVDGDSRSASQGWPTIALETAKAYGSQVYGGLGLASWAIGGQTTGGMISAATTGVDTLVRSGVKNILAVWCGVNDHGSLSAAQIYANLQSYCLARRAAGWDKIAICTEIDAQGAVSASWHTTTYPGLNTLLRAGFGTFADRLIDLGADSRLQDATDTTYYNVDQVHLTETGSAVVGEIAAPVLATLV